MPVKKRNTVFLVLVVITIVLAGTLLYSYSNTSSLDEKYRRIVAERDSLQSAATGLQNQLNILQSSYDSLQSSYGNLQSSYASLQSSYGDLQSSYDSLQNQTKELNDIVQMQKSTVLEQDKPVSLTSGKAEWYLYETPYAGTLSIQFLATGGVVFEFLSDYEGGASIGSFYARYPYSSGTAISGSFSIPVFPGTTYVKVTNPNTVIGVSMSLTMTYVY